jgi:predicted DNA-binding transcriptional regulator AlpA
MYDPESPGVVPLTELSAEDDLYIRSHFVNLTEIARLCGFSVEEVRKRQSQGEFPRPTYTTSDGVEWYPRGYAVPVRRADATGTSLRALFFQDFRRLSAQKPEETPGEDGSVSDSHIDQQILEEWKGYLSGEYGACLKVPWIPCILQKGGLMARIDALLAQPKPESWEWAIELRQAVNALDRLEQPFAHLDRIRFGGPVSRDRYIAAVRARFPQVFSGRQGPSEPPTEGSERLGSNPDEGLTC